RGCWAAGVTVDSYTIIEGSGSPHHSNMAAYVIWHITVRTLKGVDIRLNKRYSEIDQLRVDLVKGFPHAEGMLPKLPRKSLVSRFRPRFLEQRRVGLGHFLNCVVLNMEFAASPMVKEFIFA
ncbi:Phox-like protein, partial [Teratosphaeria nubilosa]